MDLGATEMVTFMKNYPAADHARYSLRGAIGIYGIF